MFQDVYDYEQVDDLAIGAARSRKSMTPINDVIGYLEEYAREKPEVVALWCLGIGFALGWKLKPW